MGPCCPFQPVCPRQHAVAASKRVPCKTGKLFKLQQGTGGRQSGVMVNGPSDGTHDGAAGDGASGGGGDRSVTVRRLKQATPAADLRATAAAATGPALTSCAAVGRSAGTSLRQRSSRSTPSCMSGGGVGVRGGGLTLRGRRQRQDVGDQRRSRQHGCLPSVHLRPAARILHLRALLRHAWHLQPATQRHLARANLP